MTTQYLLYYITTYNMWLLIVLIVYSLYAGLGVVAVCLCCSAVHPQDGLQVSKSPSLESEFSLLMLVSGQDSSSEGQQLPH